MLPENWGRYAPDILWLKVGTLDWQGYQALNITHIVNMPAHCVQGAACFGAHNGAHYKEVKFPAFIIGYNDHAGVEFAASTAGCIFEPGTLISKLSPRYGFIFFSREESP